MKKILSLIFIFALGVALVLGSLGLPDFTASADALYIHKIVSVVYDDSGSMINGTNNYKYVYAEYAMQTFCGMLNSEDKLYRTYISAPTSTTELDLSADKIQKSVENATRRGGSGTCFEAVESAYETLSGVSDSNANTQYWLVVITDGEFMTGIDTSVEKKDFLNTKFRSYANSTMLNGTTPQITFLSIGDGVIAPDPDEEVGIYTYHAANENEIMDAMSSMADKVSGRTRLTADSLKLVDSNTVQFTSAIPLLNIAVLAQGGNSAITKASYSGGKEIPISRSVDLNAVAKDNTISLSGGAYLIGDSSTVIESGKYEITFENAVDLADVVILFEPALEVKMTVSLNGKTISDFSELNSSMEGDKISVSFKICEMGTNNEISSSLLPTGTTFSIAVKEDGQVVEEVDGAGKALSDYVLKNIATKITAAVQIKDFNPIEASVEFTPTVYVKPIEYTITAEYGGSATSVKIDDVASNKDLSIRFSVYADGVKITDPEAVKALNPTVTTSVDGNGGTVTYSDGGEIVFTPNEAKAPAGSNSAYEVEVVCSIGSVSVSKSYTVQFYDYAVIAADSADSVKKTELNENKNGVSFYITKDGVKLTESQIENEISVALDEEHSSLAYDLSISADGTVTVIPYSTETPSAASKTWPFYWTYYLSLSGKDIAVTLTYTYGSAVAAVDVVEEDVGHIMLWVVLPMAVELILAALFIAWIVLIIIKPRFAKGAVLYIGTFTYTGNNRHRIKSYGRHPLKKYNNLFIFKYGWLRFSKRAKDIDTEFGVRLRAEKKGRISVMGTICEDSLNFKGGGANMQTPSDVSKYYKTHRDGIDIDELRDNNTKGGASQKISQMNGLKHLVIIKKRDSVGHILSGTVLSYIIEKRK